MQFDNVEKRHFIGLPIPAAAEVIASTVMLYYFFGGEGATYRHLIVLLMVYALAGLMVSNVRYFSFKEIDLHRRQPFWVLVAGHPGPEAADRRAADVPVRRLLPLRDLRAGAFAVDLRPASASPRPGERRLDSAAALF